MFKTVLTKSRAYAGLVVSAALLLSCVYNYVQSPSVMCVSEICYNNSFEIMTNMFPRVVSIACLLSRVTAIFKGVRAIPAYEKKIVDYELYYPTDADKERSRRILVVVAGSVCAAAILSMNLYRLYLFHQYYRVGRLGGGEGESNTF